MSVALYWGLQAKTKSNRDQQWITSIRCHLLSDCGWTVGPCHPFSPLCGLCHNGTVSPQSASQNQRWKLLPVRYWVTSMRIAAEVLWYSGLYSFRYRHGNGMGGSHGNSTFSILKNLHSDFHNVCICLHFRQQHWSFLSSYIVTSISCHLFSCW